MSTLKLPLPRLIPVVIAVLSIFSILSAQDKNAKEKQASGTKRAAFKIPDGFMPVEMPEGKKGMMMLNPEKPAGIFVAYTPENEKSEEFLLGLRKTLAGFFVHDKDVTFEWKEAPLPAHEGVTDETGKLFVTSARDKEVQIAAYIRTIDQGGDVVYGYFAMKDPKSGKNSADFVDASGKGVKAFDWFCKTLKAAK